MTPEFLITLAKESITLTIAISMPILGIGLVVGLLISIFQTVTSIQEMTLTFVPKIIAVFLGLLFFAPWMGGKLAAFTEKLIMNIPIYIR